MSGPILPRLCREALLAGSQTRPLYITREEAIILAREIMQQLSPIGYGDIRAVHDVILSDNAMMFGQPLRIMKGAPR